MSPPQSSSGGSAHNCCRSAHETRPRRPPKNERPARDWSVARRERQTEVDQYACHVNHAPHLDDAVIHHSHYLDLPRDGRTARRWVSHELADHRGRHRHVRDHPVPVLELVLILHRRPVGARYVPLPTSNRERPTWARALPGTTLDGRCKAHFTSAQVRTYERAV